MRTDNRNRTIFIILLIFLPARSFSQMEASNWISGNGINWKFTDTGIVCFPGYSIPGSDRISCISDKSGKLMFFADMVDVFTASGKIMENGNNFVSLPINYHRNFLRSIIVPNPVQSNIYYLISPVRSGKHLSNEYLTKLSLSVVDMSLNNGEGSMVLKDSVFSNFCMGEIAAVHHANGKDVWVIAPGSGTTFNSYLVTANGLSAGPVVTGLNFGLYDTLKPAKNSSVFMKAAPDGKHVVMTWHYYDFHKDTTNEWMEIVLFDFDNKSGKLSGKKVLYHFDENELNRNEFSPVSIVFSPSGRFLYYFCFDSTVPVTTRIDITLKDTAHIRQSEYKEPVHIGGGELGIDGKIHHSMALNNPDESGPFCLTKQRCILPISTPSLFISSYFYKPTFPVRINISGHCEGKTTLFRLTGGNEPDSLLWDFGDSSSVTGNYSNQNPALHRYPGQGKYHSTLYRYYDTVACPLTATVTINPGSYSTVDTSLCSNKSIKLSNGKYVEKSGIYYDTTYNRVGCDSVIAFKVNIKPLPWVELGEDITICLTDTTVLLDAGKQDYIRWLPGDENTRYLEIKSGGTYHVIVRNNQGCKVSDSVRINDECPFLIFIPNAFSPDNNGINDEFKAICPNELKSFYLSIYNRWGEKLFESNEIDKGWDATFKGKACPVGVYTYILTASDIQGRNLTKSGMLHLIK